LALPASSGRLSILTVIRTVWLLLAVFCTSLVGVQPVEITRGSHCSCACHCKVPGACGLPCTRTAAISRELAASEQSTRVAKPVANAQTDSVRQLQRKFFAPFVEPPSSVVAALAPVALAPPTAVPLFQAHCGFLI
jgi:hypothetical protein